MRTCVFIGNFGLALAAMVSGWSAVAPAEALTLRLSGYVPSRCSGSLSLAETQDSVREGFISTYCNSRHALQLVYPAELGAIEVEFAGKTFEGSNGVALLEDFAPPAISTRAVRVRFSNAEAANAPNVLAVTLAPQGL